MNPRASLPAVALALLLAGCVKPSATVEIYQGCFPPTPDSSGGCKYPAGTCATVPLDTYLIDLTLTSDFFLGVEVHNQLADNSSADTGGGNTHNAFVDRYDVSYSGPVAVEGIGGDIQQTVPSSGSSVIGVHLVNPTSAAALAPGHYIVSLTMSGKWGDQSEFETAPRTFGLDVCSGCLGIPTCTTGTPVACPSFGQSPAAFACVTGGGTVTTYALGGTVQGQTGSLILNCNGTPVAVGATDTTWTFPFQLTDGTGYNCTVTSPPAGQTCNVANGVGTVTGADVSNVNITCG